MSKFTTHYEVKIVVHNEKYSSRDILYIAPWLDDAATTAQCTEYHAGGNGHFSSMATYIDYHLIIILL